MIRVNQLKKCAFLLASLLVFVGGLQAEEHTVIKGKTGGAIPNGALALGDPFLKAIRQNQSANLTDSWLKSGSYAVRLWYDENQTNFFANGWSLEVDYSIHLQQDNYPAAPTITESNKLLKIDYSLQGDYRDEDVAYFLQSGSNPYVYSWIVINQVTYVHEDGTTLSGDDIPSNVHLDLEYTTERFYTMNQAVYPKLEATDVTNSTASGATVANELEFSWNYQAGALSYDLEWLFVDAGHDPSTNTTPLANQALAFDFRNATRVNVKDNNYRISLAYPRGVLLWRIRSVGVYAENQSEQPKFGAWSYAPAITETTDQALQYQLLDFPGTPVGTKLENTFLDEHNWEYAVQYAEDGKHKEVISFFDGSLRNRQTVTRLNTQDLAVVGETKYDHFGRGTVQVAPVPVEDEGINYYQNDAGVAFNGSYDRNDFSTDPAVGSSGTIPAMPSNPANLMERSEASQYYSSSNDLNERFQERTPDAGGYPFVQTTLKNDGTGRPLRQGGMGSDYTVGFNDHYTSYIYANAAQNELTRLFGTEVGEARYYEKVVTRDPNGQKTVQYFDQAGRVIASSYAGIAPNLLNADAKDPSVSIEIDLLATGNNLNNNQEVVSRFRLAVLSDGTDYDFVYNLTGAEYCLDCEVDPKNQTYPSSPTRCEDCHYDVEIKIIDQEGTAVWSNTQTDITSATAVSSSNITLDEGEYMVVKTLRLNSSEQQAQLNALEAWLRDDNNDDSHTCFSFPVNDPNNPCNTDCETLCEQAYQEVVDGVVQYFDANGNQMVDEYAQGYVDAVAACQSDCEGDEAGTYDFCDLKFNQLTADLSPGGQYFDNLPERYEIDAVTGLMVLDAQGNPIEVSNYESTLRDAWLNTQIGLTAFNTATGGSYASWQEVRDNWDSQYAALILNYHPEYCAYQYYCKGEDCTVDGRTVNPITESNNFDALMHARNEVDYALNNLSNASPAHSYNFLNPLLFPFSNAPGLDPDDDRSTYISNFYVSGTSGLDQDPLTAYGSSTTCAPQFATELTDYLQNFLTFTTTNGNGSISYSIWYVLDDPDDIALASSPPAGVPQLIYDFFVNLHGDGTTPGLGMIGSDPGQLNKFEFFRMAYKFYRDYLLYEDFKTSFDCDASSAPVDQYAYWNYDANYDAEHDNNGFVLNFPRSLVFDNYTPGSSPAFNNSTFTNTACAANCDAYANDWLDQYAACSGYSALSTADKQAFRQALIDICAGGCSTSNPSGLDDAGVLVAVSGPSFNAGTHNLQTFDAVRDLFLVGCTTDVNHPPAPTPTPEASCDCNLLESYAETALSTTIANITAFHPTTAQLNTVLTAIQGDYSSMNYTLTEVDGWFATCRGQQNSMDDRYPTRLSCMDCDCDNLNDWLDGFASSIDLTQPLSSTDLTNIADELLLVTGNTYTHTQIQAWAQPCSTNIALRAAGQPVNDSPTVNAAFDDYPAFLVCPSLQSIDLNSWCNDRFNNTQDENNTNELNLAVADALASFRESMYDKCFANLKTREDFTTSYDTDDFYFTLYYYDQAGNLIKTVAPQFFEGLNNSEISAANAARDAGTLTNNHQKTKFPTNYAYNSYNQLVRQNTPDGGTTHFWYDHLGRLMFSQNAKQAEADDEDKIRYSYTRYDDLGRPYESGELEANEVDALDLNQLVTAADQTTYLSGKNRFEITSSHYDEAVSSLVDSYFPNGQENLRNRISSVTFKPNHIMLGYTVATHYSYDIHGNVQELVQENTHLDHLPTDPNSNALYANHSLKRLTYDYDLISGNVNRVSYQEGQPDQFYHRYHYDADNRITVVETSRDGRSWDRDAKYLYYAHGPLARTELGQNEVQGQDFAYTIHGWLKGVNSNTLDASRDQGNDGHTAGLNNSFAQDAMGYSLGYYSGDYTAIGSGAGGFLASINPATAYANASPDLYNGNIAKMVTALSDFNETALPIHANAYRYDQLNRLKDMQVYSATDVATNNNFDNTTNTNNPYEVLLSYDRNGNINTLKRRDQAGAVMDDLEYHYLYEGAGTPSPTTGQLKKNQLYHVEDHSNYTTLTTDFKTHGAFQGSTELEVETMNNFTFDEIGNLVTDSIECIAEIEWTVSGKVKAVKRTVGCQVNGSYPSDLEFEYDAMGNRIVKITKPNTASGIEVEDHWTYTYYSRDAQGNIMAVYNQRFRPSLYAVYNRDLEELGSNSGAAPTTVTLHGGAVPGPYDQSLLPPGFAFAAGPADHNARIFELEAAINSHHSTPEWTAAVFWDAANSRQALKIYPWSYVSPSTHAIATTKVYANSTDNDSHSLVYVNGVNEPQKVQLEVVDLAIYGSSRLGSLQPNQSVFEADFTNSGYHTSGDDYQKFTGFALTTGSEIHGLDWQDDQTYRTRGHKTYELSNHLGNVLNTISDRKIQIEDGTSGDIAYFSADVLSFSDYYPFGSPLPGRTGNQGEYRFGFQGQEGDEEHLGEGNSYAFKYRIHDARLGRFLSIDPLAPDYPHNSPYAFSENRVLDGVELEGLEYLSVHDSGVDLESSKNDDGTYSFTLGDLEFNNITLETIEGNDYFRMGKHLYQNEGKWSERGKKRDRLTSDLDWAISFYTMAQFRDEIWPKLMNSPMTSDQQNNLGLGCVGLTMCFTETPTQYLPDLTSSHSTIEQARAAATELKQQIANSPGSYPEGARPVIFSLRFYTSDKERYLPDASGRVNMTEYKGLSRRVPHPNSTRGYANFDFGFLDSNGRWWHANHQEPGMRVYYGTLDSYSKPLPDFNRQVFSVTITTQVKPQPLSRK